jgi:hypothetical protein
MSWQKEQLCLMNDGSESSTPSVSAARSSPGIHRCSVRLALGRDVVDQRGTKRTIQALLD